MTKLADVIRRAFKIAGSGRPGPVLVDITKDVTAAECDYEYKQPDPVKPLSDTITEEDMERAIEIIRKSKQPVHLCGRRRSAVQCG